ncbi:MAG: kinesin-like nuclear fusion protein, partial [Pleopsidium flavum]
MSRNASFSSSVSSRTPSVSSRNTSGSSFSSSVGPGSRPQTAMCDRESLPPSVPAARPTSSLEIHAEGPTGKRKGMRPISISTFQQTPIPETFRPSKLRGSYDNQLNYTSDWSSSSATVASNGTIRPKRSFRDISLSTAMQDLTLDVTHDSSHTFAEGPKGPKTPSQLPKPIFSNQQPAIVVPTSPSKPQRSPTKIIPFLTRDSHVKAWDTKGRLEDMEYYYSELKERMNGTTDESNGLKETVSIYKTRSMSFSEVRFAIQYLRPTTQACPPRCTKLTNLLVTAVNELETIGTQLTTNNATLNANLNTTRSQLATTTSTLEDLRRRHANQVDDLQRERRNDLEAIRREYKEEVDRLLQTHREDLSELKRRLNTELEDERTLRIKEVQEITTQGALSRQQADLDIDSREREIRLVKGDLQQFTADLERERSLNRELRGNLSESSNTALTLETSIRSLKSRIEFLESDSKTQSQAFADLDQQLRDAITSAKEANSKLRTEETLRRKLHNQVQELKGNIRVFCRVRPTLESEPAEEGARISFPDIKEDSKEVEVMGPEEKSSLGNITTKTNAFAFDRVFGPSSQNGNVFEEISQLVQSALDGYNVCIFCYGQTGSGKTFTMSADDGMIPRAVHQIYDTAQFLEEKGWTYSMEGSFVEVYNENLNDLLGKPEEFDKKKHDIRHDMQKCKTTITDITTVNLDSPAKVESILRRATANRSVAATKANERSSRSHSVFILKLMGENSVTGEKSEGTLNLVDLAGSERLSHSGSTGDRLKETQNINRSLSCLGDVIGALGQGKEGGHVPYRNSK